MYWCTGDRVLGTLVCVGSRCRDHCWVGRRGTGGTGGIGECGEEEGTGAWWEVDVGSVGVHRAGTGALVAFGVLACEEGYWCVRSRG